MKNNALSIANSLLNLANKEGKTLKHLALMKLVYFAYGHALANMQKDIIDPRFDRVEAWKYGPVIPSVYHSFKHFQNDPITEKAVVMEFDEQDMPIYLTPQVTDQDLLLIITHVWNQYKSYSDSQLVALSHEPDTPWAKVYIEGENREIPERATQLYYMQKLGLCNYKLLLSQKVDALAIGKWNGHNIPPTPEEVIRNTKMLIALCPTENILSNAKAFPSENGTILLKIRTVGKITSINIGQTDFSYAIINASNPDEYTGGNYTITNTSAIKSLYTYL